MSQDTTQSLWDPALGSSGYPGSGKIQLVKFSPFSSQICLAKLPKPPWDHPVGSQNPSAGVPAGNQVLGCLLQCPKTPCNHFGTLPWGPQAPWVQQNQKYSEFHPFRGPPPKIKVEKPPKTPRKQKNRNSSKMRPLHQKSLLTTI